MTANINRIIRTPRSKLRLGDLGVVNGKPVLIVKTKKSMDYITAEEVVEAIFNRQVECIVFKGADMERT